MNSLWDEIKRRNIVRVAVTYAVVAWLTAQVADFATDTFGAPPWVLQIFVVFLLLGFPLAVLLAWAYDLTPHGIRRTSSAAGESDADARPPRQNRAVFIVFILLALSFAAWLQFYGLERVILTHDGRNTFSPSADNNLESLHFDLVFPEAAPLALIGAAELGNGKQAFAISPNGKLVVYAGASDEGYQLYLRDISGHTTAAIEGTNGAFSPFFSPNSMWVGYFDGNELFKVNVKGGKPVFIANATNSVGGTWTDEDEIVMVIEEGQQIVKVPASGGEVEDIPIDDRLYYPTAVRNQQKITVFGQLLDLDSSQFEELPIQSRDIRYANGFLFFIFQGSLHAARYDLATNRLESSPAPVITGVRTEIWGAAQWSLSDNGTLLYMPGRDARSNPLVWVNATESKALNLPVRYRGSMEISPDGRRLAITEYGATTSDIWIYDLSNGRATKLTTDGINLGPLFWSPDNASVYYQKLSGSNEVTHRRFIDSQLPAELVFESMHTKYSATSISADGRVMGLHGSAYNAGIAIYDVITKKATPVSSASSNDWGTAVSPDGRAIVYTSGASGAYNIFLQPIPATGKRYQVSREDGSEEPRWSADGSKIYYRSGTRIMVADVVMEPEIIVGEPQVFYSGVFENVGGRSYAIHPDGERALVISSENLASSIRVITNWFSKVERIIQENRSDSD